MHQQPLETTYGMNAKMKDLVRPGVLIILIALITAQHYLVAFSHQNLWLHNIHYLLNFLPILIGAIWYGFRGGIAVSILVSILYAPIAFGHLGQHVLTSATQRVLEVIIYNAVGLVTGVLSEREKRQRERSARMDTELQQTRCLATVGEMVSMVAHEIRNPLQSIRIGVELIRGDIGPDEEKIDLLKDIEKGLDSLDEIVNDLLDYSRPMALTFSSASIHDIVHRALKTLAHKLDDISVRMDLEQGEKSICLDVAKFTRVLVNFISNAIDAMPNGGDLIIRSRVRRDKGTNVLTLTIADTGCGIDDTRQKWIHEPFFTTKYRGTGLGIPICRKIIEAHGGSYSIRSAVGEGTSVEVMAPLRDRERSEYKPAAVGKLWRRENIENAHPSLTK